MAASSTGVALMVIQLVAFNQEETISNLTHKRTSKNNKENMTIAATTARTVTLTATTSNQHHARTQTEKQSNQKQTQTQKQTKSLTPTQTYKNKTQRDKNQ